MYGGGCGGSGIYNGLNKTPPASFPMTLSLSFSHIKTIVMKNNHSACINIIMYGTRLMDEFENWHQAPAGGTHLDEWMINVSQAHQRGL